MLEAHMEELIAKYPGDFFPRKTWILSGRQGSFAGVGRYDLMFVDEHKTNILMELKARTAKYEDASQLAKYYDALKAQGTKNVLMWLVAPAIPPSVREFLDRIGIEYSEIHESEYKSVAVRHGEGIEVIDDAVVIEVRSSPVQKRVRSARQSESVGFDSKTSKSKIQPKFRSSMNRLSSSFPAAYEFITWVIHHSEEGFRLLTDVNAHLYYKDSFLAYMLIVSGGIEFRPKFNNLIEGTATDRHDLIFPDVFRKLTAAGSGKVEPWAHFGRNDSVIIGTQAPAEFFTRLIEEIKRVHAGI